MTNLYIYIYILNKQNTLSISRLYSLILVYKYFKNVWPFNFNPFKETMNLFFGNFAIKVLQEKKFKIVYK